MNKAMFSDAKVCVSCDEVKLLEDFWKDKKTKSGYHSYCKSCHNERRKEWRLNNPERQKATNQASRWKYREKARKRQAQYRHDFPERNGAQQTLNKAIAKGEIMRPNCCSICDSDSTRIEGHHSNYDEPLNVSWLCVPCHRNQHHTCEKKDA